MNTDEKFHWRKYDYYWIIGILIGIIVLVVTLRLSNDSDVVNIISLIAGFSSICLAFVAIIQSQDSSTATKRLYDKMNDKLDDVNSNTLILKTKIEEMKDSLITSVHQVVDENKDIPETSKNELKETVDYVVNDVLNDSNYFHNYYNSFMNNKIVGGTTYCINEYKQQAVSFIYNNIKKNMEENDILTINGKDSSDIFYENKEKIYLIDIKVYRGEFSITTELKIVSQMYNKIILNKIDTNKIKNIISIQYYGNICKIYAIDRKNNIKSEILNIDSDLYKNCNIINIIDLIINII